MPCSCKSRLDTILAVLESLQSEVRDVKTKCNQIQKELLGITNESEGNSTALMETSTVRHVMEEVAHKVSLLSEEFREKNEADQREIHGATEEIFKKIQTDLSVAKEEKLRELKQEYDILDETTFLTTQFAEFKKSITSKVEVTVLSSAYSQIPYSQVQDIRNRFRSMVKDAETEIWARVLERNESQGKEIRGQFRKLSMRGLRYTLHFSGPDEVARRLDLLLSEFKISDPSLKEEMKQEMLLNL